MTEKRSGMYAASTAMRSLAWSIRDPPRFSRIDDEELARAAIWTESCCCPTETPAEIPETQSEAATSAQSTASSAEVPVVLRIVTIIPEYQIIKEFSFLSVVL